MCDARPIATKPRNDEASVIAAIFIGLFPGGSSILLCSLDAENPATAPTIIPAAGLRNV